ncbi:longitudinals lacking protein, isoforms H/M/V-like [Culicoides brevitarsis]|uniref:longitudinals lacking protein, isoforms H/M/V-like n=1 Tax=Culicoides brevitarsis TaxID=469753 RepID=UPI00307C58EA
MSVQQYCLRWNNHQPNFISVFSSLLHSEALVDVTLAAEGRQLQAHKVVLSACSSYFQALFTANPCQHPIVILKDVQFNDLKTIVDFMYYGEVNVSTEQLPQILKTAETLKIKGLAELPEAGGALAKQENVAAVGNGSESIWGSTESQTASAPSNEQQLWQQQQRCSVSPPNAGSPAMRRKRLKKSDSGSQERHYQEQAEGNSNSRSVKEESVTESTELPKQESTQDFPEDESMKIEADVRAVLVPSSSVEATTINMSSSSSSHGEGSSSPAVLTHSQSVSGTSSSTTTSVGSKRQRLLIRQPRVKKELEGHLVQSGSNTPETPESSQLYTTCLLTVPSSRVMERTASEPAPSSAGKTTIAPATNSPNLLSVPTQSHLVKQHSHPLLPSQSNSATYTFHRQLSHPVSSSGSTTPSAHTQKSSIEHHKSFDSAIGSASHQTPNPLVVIIPDTSATTSETFTTSTSTPSSGLLTVGGAAAASHKMKPDEFTRSISSPLSSTTSRELLSLENTTTRSSHCPVTRPGPALGCNYCWNTIDAHGRILRRKTKYHCPECQTNLCIVPCFQEYHERWQNENPPTNTEPALKSSQRHQYAKSGSM